MEDDPNRRKHGEVLASALSDAGANGLSAIRVLGPNALAVLIWLCRKGYQNVSYRRSGCPARSEDGDVLLIPGPCTPAELETMLEKGAAPLRGGLLVVQTTGERAPDGSDPVHPVLERLGYRVERCIHTGRRELHVARRQSDRGLAQAA